jgi:UDP-N-acetylmuramoyl-tripeptide--D-alanyl-D-alanine ligase
MLLQTAKHIIVYLLTLEAKAVLRRYNPKIVAVTGSVGKTSAKDALYAVLSQGHHVRKSEKSFNSELGVPLTILGLPNAWGSPWRWLVNLFDGLLIIIFGALPSGRQGYPEWLVLEVGADRPGDIRRAAQWLPIDIAVITRLPEMPVHVEYFDSPEAVVKEKAELIKALKPDGTLILFGDDERARELSLLTKNPVLTFGFEERNDVQGQQVELLFEGGQGAEAGWPVGMQAQLRVGDATAPVEVVGSVGAHALIPLLAGAALGRALGKSLEEAIEALRAYEPPAGRMRLVHGVKNTLLIDDTYNSSPAAVGAALDTLALVRSKGRRVAVLGDMLELGRHSVKEHRKIGAQAAKAAEVLVTVGFRARDIAEGALESGMKDESILQYEDARKAGAELQNLLQEGDCVLIKGSQSMRMERVVEELMAEPGRAADLLVRQDEEWKRR